MALTTDPVTSPRHGRRSGLPVDPRRVRACGRLPPVASGRRRSAPSEIPVGVVRPRRAGWGRRYSFGLLLADLLGLLVAALVVHLIRFPPVTPTAPSTRSSALRCLDRGARDRLDAGADLVRQPGSETIGYGAIEYKRVIHATFAVFGVAAIASYLFKLELPRSYLLVMMPVGLAALLAVPVRLASVAAPPARCRPVPVPGAGRRQYPHRHRAAPRPAPRPAGRLQGDRRLHQPAPRPSTPTATGRGDRRRPGARRPGRHWRNRAVLAAPTPSPSPLPRLSGPARSASSAGNSRTPTPS